MSHSAASIIQHKSRVIQTVKVQDTVESGSFSLANFVQNQHGVTTYTVCEERRVGSHAEIQYSSLQRKEQSTHPPCYHNYRHMQL